MELKQLTERVWFMPYEEERDRPNLGYIKGDNWALAVDAGHSEEHVNQFYALLEKEGLPLPDLTVNYALALGSHLRHACDTRPFSYLRKD